MMNKSVTDFNKEVKDERQERRSKLKQISNSNRDTMVMKHHHRCQTKVDHVSGPTSLFSNAGFGRDYTTQLENMKRTQLKSKSIFDRDKTLILNHNAGKDALAHLNQTSQANSVVETYAHRTEKLRVKRRQASLEMLPFAVQKEKEIRQRRATDHQQDVDYMKEKVSSWL